MMYQYNATLIRVIDGDTLEMNIDLGFYCHYDAKLRLRGVNAPERFTEGGKVATSFVKDWFAEYPNVVLYTHKTDLTDKYGRWVADVARPDGHDLALDMIAAGVAVPFLP